MRDAYYSTVYTARTRVAGDHTVCGAPTRYITDSLASSGESLGFACVSRTHTHTHTCEGCGTDRVCSLLKIVLPAGHYTRAHSELNAAAPCRAGQKTEQGALTRLRI